MTVSTPSSSPRLGRALLMASAYGPAAIVIGCRAWPHMAGKVALLCGIAGVAVWAAFLRWLGQAQPRRAEVEDVQPLDGEVTAYVATYLLPLLAAPNPSDGDLIAYAICAVLILIVGYVADLGAINPVIYLFGLRTARAVVDGRPMVILLNGDMDTTDPLVVRGPGIVRVR